MKLTLGFSPCPNDTFIFDALVNKKINSGDLDFEVCIDDVETLNEWALEGRCDITKLSFPAFFKSTEDYLLLNAGAALARGAGPLLVSSEPGKLSVDEIENRTIVLPGENTTAHLLFSYAFPKATNKIFLRFDSIEKYVLDNPGTLGVIIHENRFTYEQRGLHKQTDLGDHWETHMHSPVPLGGIAINQSVKRTVALRINKLIQESVQYAFDKYPLIPAYVKEHSLSMNEEVMRQHINLYVNKYTLDLGDEGREAISKMYELFASVHDLETESADLLFL